MEVTDLLIIPFSKCVYMIERITECILSEATFSIQTGFVSQSTFMIFYALKDKSWIFSGLQFEICLYFNLGLLALGLLSPIQFLVFYLIECWQSQTERTHPKQNDFIMMNWRYKKQVQKLFTRCWPKHMELNKLDWLFGIRWYILITGPIMLQ